MANLEKTVAHFNSNKENFINELIELVKIPSVSFPGFDPNDVKRSAEKTAELMTSHGLKNVKVIPFEGAHPYVYGEWLEAPGKPTLLLYAHHDVQPPGQVDLWKSPPFEPTMRDGRLFARGAADDKAGVMCHLAAIGSFFESGKSPAQR